MYFLQSQKLTYNFIYYNIYMSTKWNFEDRNTPKSNQLADALAQTIAPKVLEFYVSTLAHHIVTHQLQDGYLDAFPKILKHALRAEQTIGKESLLVVIHTNRMVDRIMSLLPEAIKKVSAT